MIWSFRFKPTPWERQTSAGGCGVTCLRMIFKARGWPVPSHRRIRQLAKTNRRGTSFAGILRAAAGLGVTAQVVQLRWEALVNEALPAIAPVLGTDGLGHFVVVDSVDRDSLWISDPAKGVERVGKEDFLARWTGKLIIFGPHPPSIPHLGEGKQEPALRLFLHLLTTQKLYFVFGSICVVLYTLLVLAGLLILRHLMEAMVSHGSGSLVTSQVVSLVIGIGLCLLFFGVFRSFFEYLTVRAKFRVQALLAQCYANHLEQLPEKVVRSRGSSDLLALWKSDIVKIREAAGVAFTIVCNFARVVLLWAVIAAFSWQLAKLLTVGLVAVPCLAAWMKRSLRATTRESGEFASRAERHLAGRLAGSRESKLHQPLPQRSLLTEQRLLESTWLSANLAHRKLLAAAPAKLLGWTLRVASLVMTTTWALRGTMTFRDVIVIYVLVTFLMHTVEHIGTLLAGNHDPVLPLERLRAVLDEPTEPGTQGQVHLEATAPTVRFEQVSVDAGRDSHGTVRELSFQLPAGRAIAIVDRSGSRRASVRDLLTGFAEPASGRIYLNDVDLRDIQLDSLRSAVACIDSRQFIYQASVFENVALGKPNASLTEVVRACQLAGLHGFVNDLPNRYEEVIGGRGVPLNRRQRRQVALARAVLKDPQCIVLDAQAWADSAVGGRERRILADLWPAKTKVILTPTHELCREIELTTEMRGRAVEATSAESLTGGV